MSDFEIKIDSLCLDAGKKKVLEDVSITFNSGFTYLIYGRNGAGKSSLIECLLNLNRSYNGTCTFLKDGENLSAKNLKKTYLPEELEMPRGIRIKDFQNSFRMLLEAEQRFNKSLHKYICEKFELDSFDAKEIGHLSKGMKKLILISIVLSSESDLLVLDEPLEGLDTISKEYLIEVLINEAKKGRIIIISSHEIATINNRFDRVISMRNGRITRVILKDERLEYNELLSLI
ncbi:ATP-binding cassette domain-containing protein [Gracilimonas sp.]|uniref:ATP-binding cassette domain-containing protein n=1 Tax=Gracilimonas sp. TaxID=1974203 RepID=UPI003BA9CACB